MFILCRIVCVIYIYSMYNVRIVFMQVLVRINFVLEFILEKRLLRQGISRAGIATTKLFP